MANVQVFGSVREIETRIQTGTYAFLTTGAAALNSSIGSDLLLAGGAVRIAGLGKQIVRSGSLCTVEYFDSPMSQPVVHEIESDLIERVTLAEQPRVYHFDEAAHSWEIGRLLKDHGGRPSGRPSMEREAPRLTGQRRSHNSPCCGISGKLSLYCGRLIAAAPLGLRPDATDAPKLTGGSPDLASKSRRKILAGIESAKRSDIGDAAIRLGLKQLTGTLDT